MSFTNEDRKQVYDFFDSLLLEIGRPIFYDHLRGYVAYASPIVRKFVHAKCKGENLLEYFKTRKNYFEVDKFDVSLKWNRLQKLSYTESEKSKKSKEYEKMLDEDEDISIFSNAIETDCNDSVLNMTSDNNEKILYEEMTVTHFVTYLKKRHELYISEIELTELPKKVKYYLTQYLNKNVTLFFQSYPYLFVVDETCVRLTTNPFDVKLTCKNETIAQSQDAALFESDVANQNGIGDEDSEEFTAIKSAKECISNASGVIDKNVLDIIIKCAEFFVRVLKKKKKITLDKLSGYLAQAPVDVLPFLQVYFKPFRLFLETVPEIFIINNSDEVSLSSNYDEILKQARQMLSELSENSQIQQSQNQNQTVSKQTKIVPHEVKKAVNSPLLKNDFLPTELSEVVKMTSSSAKGSKCKVLNEMENTVNFSTSANDSIPKVQNELCEIISSSTSLNGCAPKVHKEIVNSSTSDPKNAKNSSKDSSESDLLYMIKNQATSKVDSTSVVIKTQSIATKEINSTSAVIKTQSIATKEINSTSVVIKTQSIANPSIDIDFKNVDEVCEIPDIFFECMVELFYIVHLLCYEMVEEEHILCLEHDYDAVNFFVDILDQHPNSVKYLQGKLGQAPEKVREFMKRLYKGDKIKQFFDKHKEFDFNLVDLSVNLSRTYQNDLKEKLMFKKSFIKTKAYFDNLCSDLFVQYCIDVFKVLLQITLFLEKKEKTKFSRLCGIISNSPSFQDVINKFSGKDPLNKLKIFLSCFKMFVPYGEDYVALNSELKCTLLLNLLRGLSDGFGIEGSKYLTAKHKNFITALKKTSNEPSQDDNDIKLQIRGKVKSYLNSVSSMRYSDLPKVLDPVFLHTVFDKEIWSADLIWILFDSNLFEVSNGLISLKKIEENLVSYPDNAAAQIMNDTSNENLEKILNIHEIENHTDSFISEKNDEWNLSHNNIIIDSNLDSSNSGDSFLSRSERKCISKNEIGTSVDSYLNDNNSILKGDYKMEKYIASKDYNLNYDKNILENNHKMQVQNVLSKHKITDISHLLCDKNKETSVLCDNSFDLELFFDIFSSNEVSKTSEFVDHGKNELVLVSEQDVTLNHNVSSYSPFCKPTFEDSPNDDNIGKNEDEFSNDCSDTKYFSTFPNGIEKVDQNYSLSNGISDTASTSIANLQTGDISVENVHFVDTNVAYSEAKRVSNSVLDSDLPLNRNHIKTFKRISSYSCDKNIDNKIRKSDKNGSDILDQININSNGLDPKIKSGNTSNYNFSTSSNENISQFVSLSEVITMENLQNITEKSCDAPGNKNTAFVSSSLNACKSSNIDKLETDENKVCDASGETENITSAAFNVYKEENCNLFEDTNSAISEELVDQNSLTFTNNFNSLMLQPLAAEILLLASNFCIADSIINGKTKSIFCLKSAFHCDLHSDCLCYDSLNIGDIVSCYIQPLNLEHYPARMCFSFMFCKETENQMCNNLRFSEPAVSSYKTSQPKVLDPRNPTDHRNLQCQQKEAHSSYLSPTMVEKECQVDLVVFTEEAQTRNINGDQDVTTEFIHPNSYLPKEYHVNLLPFPQTADTAVQAKIFENSQIQTEQLHLQFAPTAQSTQILFKSSETESQTEISMFCFEDKYSQASVSFIHQDTQTAVQHVKNGTQTNVTGDIKICVESTSAMCQTVLSETENFKKHSDLPSKACQATSTGHDAFSQTSLASSHDEFCQTSLVSSHDKFSQTYLVPSHEEYSQTNEATLAPYCQTSLSFDRFNLHTESKSLMESNSFFDGNSKEFNDVGSQTYSTGTIAMMKYFI